MVKRFSSRRTEDDVTNRNFKDIEQLSNEIVSGRLLDNIIIENLELSTAISQVSHRLNRRPIGWLILRKNADVNIYEPKESRSPSNIICLQATSTVTVDILFF